jgi:hypothetical protein
VNAIRPRPSEPIVTESSSNAKSWPVSRVESVDDVHDTFEQCATFRYPTDVLEYAIRPRPSEPIATAENDSGASLGSTVDFVAEVQARSLQCATRSRYQPS